MFNRISRKEARIREDRSVMGGPFIFPPQWILFFGDRPGTPTGSHPRLPGLLPGVWFTESKGPHIGLIALGLALHLEGFHDRRNRQVVPIHLTTFKPQCPLSGRLLQLYPQLRA